MHQTYQFQHLHAQPMDNEKKKRFKWSSLEDYKLLQARSELGSNWKAISKQITGRNPSQCSQRWKKIKPQEEKITRKWTEQEDQQLLHLMNKYHKKWKLIAQNLKSRTGNQVRERFVNHLDPLINKDKWTDKEDLQLWEYYLQFGSKWSKIGSQLKGRPQNMIKNRFYSYIRSHYGKQSNPYYQYSNDQEGKDIGESLSQCEIESMNQQSLNKSEFTQDHNKINCIFDCSQFLNLIDLPVNEEIQ